MRDPTCGAICVLAVSLMLIGCEGRGVDLGLCADAAETCQCGNPSSGIQVQIPIKECTYFYRWKPYCKACDEYDRAALCSQFRHCLSCNPSRNGKCATCPVGRYGDSCQGVCQCQNNGRCKNDGTCQCSGGFTGARCEQRVAVSCGSAPSLDNGRVTGGIGGSVSQGTVATYSCNQGYILVGPQRKRCEDGTWSGGEPRCEYSCTTPTPTPQLGVNVEEYRTMSTPDNPNGVALVRRVSFTCADGYRLVGASELNCLPTARWNAALPVCVQDCGQPPNLHNGRYEGTRWTEGQVVRYYCNDRWTLSGDSSLTCRGGQWTGTAPTCSEVTCSRPPVLNGVLTPSSDTYATGSSVSISCAPGFSLDGASSLRCRDGAWNEESPRCERVTTTQAPVTCPTFTAPANGGVTAPDSSGVFLPGQSVEFTCNEGYLLSGNNRLICQADGSWTGGPARCIRVVTCGDPGTPVNGIRNVQQPLVGRGGRGRIRGRFGNRGRLRTNSAVIGRNGVNNGSVVDISLPEGRFRVLTRITFECESRFYELVGPQHRECQLNGQWSGRQPTCIPICGKSDGARAPVIHNGEVSVLGEWPWQASIAHRQNDGSFYGVCGGTLVTESWIITAAHCVTNRSTSNIMPLRNIKIYLGMYYRDFQRHDSDVQVFDVSEIHVHPSYNPTNLDSDIALVRLYQPATFTNRVAPVCLASVGNDGVAFTNRLLEPGLSVTVTGWGETENFTDASVLMKTQLGIISSTSCEDKYAQSGLSLEVTSNMFCAGHDDGRSDTCFGDSGGPAVAVTGTGENRKWYLVGVVSWGSPLGCALQMQYSGFTKMSRFLSFVNQFTGF